MTAWLTGAAIALAIVAAIYGFVWSIFRAGANTDAAEREVFDILTDDNVVHINSPCDGRDTI